MTAFTNQPWLEPPSFTAKNVLPVSDLGPEGSREDRMNHECRKYRLIDRREVIRATLRERRAVLLEASSLEEFNARHLPGARWLDYWQEPGQIEEVVGERHNAIIVYCRGESLRNAERAAEHLFEMGYEILSIYAGGKLDWETGGLAFEGTAQATVAEPGALPRDGLGGMVSWGLPRKRERDCLP